MKKVIYTVLASTALLFASCSKDDGPSDATLNVTAGIENTSGASGKNASLQSKNPGTLSFTSGYIRVVEVVFDGTFTSGQAVSRTVGRSSQIDFATGIASPSLDDITIPIGSYQDVNLGIELRDEDNRPAILMEGTYTRTDNTEVPVRFEFNSGEVFEAESDQTIEVMEEQVVTAKIVFDPNVWFSVVSTDALDNANVNGDGVMVISSTNNAGIFDAVADRLDVSTQSRFN